MKAGGGTRLPLENKGGCKTSLPGAVYQVSRGSNLRIPNPNREFLPAQLPEGGLIP